MVLGCGLVISLYECMRMRFWDFSAYVVMGPDAVFKSL